MGSDVALPRNLTDHDAQDEKPRGGHRNGLETDILAVMKLLLLLTPFRPRYLNKILRNKKISQLACSFQKGKNEDAAMVRKGVGKSFDDKMQDEIINTYEFKVVQQDLGR